jgi:hypothetical protein
LGDCHTPADCLESYLRMNRHWGESTMTEDRSVATSRVCERRHTHHHRSRRGNRRLRRCAWHHRRREKSRRHPRACRRHHHRHVRRAPKRHWISKGIPPLCRMLTQLPFSLWRPTLVSCHLSSSAPLKRAQDLLSRLAHDEHFVNVWQ